MQDRRLFSIGLPTIFLGDLTKKRKLYNLKTETIVAKYKKILRFDKLVKETKKTKHLFVTHSPFMSLYVCRYVLNQTRCVSSLGYKEKSGSSIPKHIDTDSKTDMLNIKKIK